MRTNNRIFGLAGLFLALVGVLCGCSKIVVETEEGQKKAVSTCKLLGLDGIVAIGGAGTFRGGRRRIRRIRRFPHARAVRRRIGRIATGRGVRRIKSENDD